MFGGVAMVWLSEQITRHGIGNGIAMILFIAILDALRRHASAIELTRQGAVSAFGLFNGRRRWRWWL